jgi:hypothetical protein
MGWIPAFTCDGQRYHIHEPFVASQLLPVIIDRAVKGNLVDNLVGELRGACIDVAALSVLNGVMGNRG